MRFSDSNGTTNEFVVVQQYNGLNIWDQLDVNIEVSGNLPAVPADAAVSYADASDAYEFQGSNKIVSENGGSIQVDADSIKFAINQVVSSLCCGHKCLLIKHWTFLTPTHFPSPKSVD